MLLFTMPLLGCAAHVPDMLWFGMPPVLQPLVRSADVLALPWRGGNTGGNTGVATRHMASSQADLLERRKV